MEKRTEGKQMRLARKRNARALQQQKVRQVAVVLAAAVLGGFGLAGEAAAQTPTVSPDGIYAESRARRPVVKREDLDAAGQRIYDALRAPGGRYANGIGGPAGMWMYSPEVAAKATALGEVVRNSPIVGHKLLELAIAVLAVEPCRA
jgi:hypothetical protein